MKLPEYSINNRSVILFASVLLLLGGIYSYMHLGKLEDPHLMIKTAVIVTPYPGASPHEVELLVTDVVEKAAKSSDEVEDIRSISKPGLSIVYVDLYSTNRVKHIPQLWDMLRRKINGCQQLLPPGAGPSVVHDDYSDVYGVFLALTGDGFSYAELKNYADYFKRELLLVKDVSRIQLFGIQKECININISRAKIDSLGIPIGSIMEALNRRNAMLNPGALETENRRVRLRVSGDYRSLDDIGNFIVTGKDGEQFFLKDLARITRGYLEPAETMMRFNGKPAIGISISTSSDGNVVYMGDAVQKRMDELMQGLPVGIKLDGIYYQSKFVKDAISKVIVNLMQSVSIVIFVLLITMGVRAGLIVGSGLVFSIFGTFIIMSAWGIELQRVSLAAMMIVMGMIVDNAIVVVDGSLVRLQQGESRFSSLVNPARETAWPLLGATVVSCMAFLPIYLSPDNSGEYLASLFQVVSAALLTSWVLALSQTPVFSSFFLKIKENKQDIDPFSGKVYGLYKGVLEFALRRRALTLTFMALLLILSMYGFRYVPKMFYTESDKAQFFIDYWLPEGAGIQTVSHELKALEDHLKTLPEVKNFAACIGSGPPRYMHAINPEPQWPNYAQVMVNAHDYREIKGLVTRLDAWLREHFPDADPRIRTYYNGPPFNFKFEARFSGPDPKVLRDLANQAKQIMRTDPLTKYVRDDWRQRVPVWELCYSSQKGGKTGIKRSDIAVSTMSLTDGAPVSFFRENDELIPILIKTNVMGAARSGGMENTPIWGSGPTAAPLGQILSGSGIQWEDPIIRRYNQRRAIKVMCDPTGITGDQLFARLSPKISSITLPTGYTLKWEGEHEMAEDEGKGVAQNLPLVLIVMTLILVVLFKGLRQPLIIALIVPFAVVGITGGLLITGLGFGFVSLIGAYSLIGMLIKNAVVLIDKIDAEIGLGKDPLQAVKESSISRMRPVMMASVTTICGMIPLLTDTLFATMAATVMFGLAFGTILTLIVAPVLYTIFFRIKTVPLSRARIFTLSKPW